jgi:hypothetical protein
MKISAEDASPSIFNFSINSGCFAFNHIHFNACLFGEFGIQFVVHIVMTGRIQDSPLFLLLPQVCWQQQFYCHVFDSEQAEKSITAHTAAKVL